jgi:lipid A 3-O-deacylase
MGRATPNPRNFRNNYETLYFWASMSNRQGAGRSGMRPLSRKLTLLTGFAGALLASPYAISTECTTAEKPARGGIEFQVFVENDLLAHTDRYYTNGVKIGIGVPGETLTDVLCDSSKSTLAPFLNVGEAIHLGLFLGQNIYTPKSITVAAPQPFDRPWAAWSYLGGVAQQVNTKGTALDTVEIDVGVVGPAAFGEEVQSWWHRQIGASKPLGWANQIPNEPAFLVSYVHKQKFKSHYFELIPHVGATAGNVFTLARAGGIARAGIHMTGFGPDSIEPGGAMLQSTRNAHDADERKKLEVYGFVGFDARLVARNIFLDGTLFRDSPSVSHRNYVHDLTAGASIRYKSFRISLTRILRSEEFYTTKGGGGKQIFDSLNVGLEF